MATRIKRYEARVDQYDDMLARIETEMGPDAQLSKPSWYRRGGFLGLFGGQQMVEVVATLEIAEPPPVQPAPAVVSDGQPEPAATGYTPAGVVEPPAGRTRSVDLSADAPAGIEPLDSQPDTGVPSAALQPGARQPTVRKVEFPRAQPGLPAGAAERITADARQFASRQPPVAPSPPEPGADDPPAGPTAAAVAAQPAITALPDLPAVAQTAGDISDISELRESISELKESITLLAEQQRQALDRFKAETPEAAVPAPVEAEPAVGAASPETPGPAAAGSVLEPGLSQGVANPVVLDRGAELADTQRRVYDRLLDWNIGSYDSLALLNTAQAGHTGAGDPSEDELLKLIFKEICRNILLSEGIHLRPTPPGKVVALVGATGVGKTTTIAKLAAHFAFHQNARVSFVSLDNYRIAAAEQLRTYADIMGLDFNIVFSRDEFDQVLTERRACDLTLIDTAGRSPTNTKQIYELRELFSAHPPDEVHLVVSACTKADDLRMLLENFEPLSYDHVIVSKLDETRSLGCLYNLSKFCQQPISYLTVGQSVPEDIRIANLAFVRTWIEQGRIT